MISPGRVGSVIFEMLALISKKTQFSLNPKSTTISNEPGNRVDWAGTNVTISVPQF